MYACTDLVPRSSEGSSPSPSSCSFGEATGILATGLQQPCVSELRQNLKANVYWSVVQKSFQSENVYYKYWEEEKTTRWAHTLVATTRLPGSPAAVLQADATAQCARVLGPA